MNPTNLVTTLKKELGIIAEGVLRVFGDGHFFRVIRGSIHSVNYEYQH